MRLRDALEALNAQIEAQWQSLANSLSFYDERIATADPAVWAEVQATQARLAYLAKWRAQIREILLGLML